jgi:PAS domain S-box-containing protein
MRRVVHACAADDLWQSEGVSADSMEGTRRASNPLRLLSIEDNPDDYELLVSLLKASTRHSYAVDWARDFADGFEALMRGNYDVCIVDYALGSRDGVDLVFQATEAGTYVPMIFLTGKGDAGVEKRALSAGAADFLVKGDIDAERLERAIRHSVERGRIAATLRERERQLRAVFDGTLDAMLIANDDGQYVDANEAALALLGLTREQLSGTGITDTAPVDATEKEVRGAWAEFLRTGRADGEFRLRRKDGKVLVIEHRGTARIMKGRHLSVFRDVTERKQIEDQRLRLSAMVESAVDAIAGITLDGSIEYWSPSCGRIFGYSSHEVTGEPLRIVVPEDRLDEFERMLQLVNDGEAVRDRETVRHRRDGTLFAASVTLAPVVQRGKIVAVSAVTRDISEKKKLEAQLAISDRMASMGTLAAGVAHEINNPLAALTANLDLLAEQLGARPPLDGSARPNSASSQVLELLGDARSSAQRIRRITRDLKLFSRPDERQRGAVELHGVIDSTIQMAWNEIRHRARLVKDYGDVLPVHGNETELAQVFLNLLVNAAQSIPEGSAKANEIRISTTLNDSGHVAIEIRDTGVGIPAAALKHVFDPFFTTKPAGVGTGLGLSICRRIVDDLGGTISVESAPGEGTTFRVILAVSTAEPRAPSPPVVVQPPSSHRGSVLVLDDEPVVAKAVRHVLEAEHDVTVCTNASDALEMVKRGARYDVIVCDMMMPEMTGASFYEAFRAMVPGDIDRILFLTGGAFSNTAQEFLDRVPNERVEKPFSAAELRAIVERRVVALRDHPSRLPPSR